MNTSRVVHCKKDKFDIYIGRGSIWGNPYKIGTDGDRDEVIRKYCEYIVQCPSLLARIPELQGKVLGCWCAPKHCHGDVLVAIVDFMSKQEELDPEAHKILYQNLWSLYD